MSRYREQAERWMQEDPDPHTREQLAAMLDDERALADCFGEMLSFGTAGLRGALGPGPNRMNRALVRRVAAQIAKTSSTACSNWSLTTTNWYLWAWLISSRASARRRAMLSAESSPRPARRC